MKEDDEDIVCLASVNQFDIILSPMFLFIITVFLETSNKIDYDEYKDQVEESKKRNLEKQLQ
jgi:hypothetical protein